MNEKNIKIIKREYAFNGYASTYNAEILNSFNPELQHKDTESAIKSNLTELLSQLRRFKFVTILVLVFKKMESKDKTKYGNSSSKAEIMIVESDIENVFKSIYATIVTNTQKSLGKGSHWILQRELILKIQNSQPKLDTFTKLKKRITSALVFLAMKKK